MLALFAPDSVFCLFQVVVFVFLVVARSVGFLQALFTKPWCRISHQEDLQVHL